MYSKENINTLWFSLKFSSTALTTLAKRMNDLRNSPLDVVTMMLADHTPTVSTLGLNTVTCWNTERDQESCELLVLTST